MQWIAIFNTLATLWLKSYIWLLTSRFSMQFRTLTSHRFLFTSQQQAQVVPQTCIREQVWSCDRQQTLHRTTNKHVESWTWFLDTSPGSTHLQGRNPNILFHEGWWIGPTNHQSWSHLPTGHFYVAKLLHCCQGSATTKLSAQAFLGGRLIAGDWSAVQYRTFPDVHVPHFHTWSLIHKPVSPVSPI